MDFTSRFQKAKRPQKKKRRTALGGRRRKLLKIKAAIAVSIVLTLIILTGWLLRFPEVTISNIEIKGNDITPTEDIEILVRDHLGGSYLFVVPKRSTFFIPDKKIMHDVDETFPRISRVVVTKMNAQTIIVEVQERKPFALWCGETYMQPGEKLGQCYFMDELSYIYANAPDFSGNVFFRYFGEIAQPTKKNDPLGATFMSEDNFFGIRPFIQAFEDLGYNPISLTSIDGRDFELRMSDSSRIIFSTDIKLSVLLDNMESILDSDAFHAAGDKEVDYIDLRFGNKVYYKFVGEEVSEPASVDEE